MKESFTLSDKGQLLIILMGSLGDVVRGFSILPPLRNQVPALNIVWLVEPKCAELVQLHPMIDEVIVFERSKGLSALKSLYRELKARHFDLTLDMQRHFKSGLFSFFSGARCRVGFNPRDAKEFNWLFNNSFIDHFPDSIPKIRAYQDFLRKADVKISGPLQFGLKELIPDLKETGVRLPKDYIAIVLGSSWPSKDWPMTAYERFIRFIVTESDYIPVLIGGKDQQDQAKSLSKKFPVDRLLNYTGTTTLKDLLIILDGAVLAVGPDTGPGHIAAALSVPYISVFGPTDEKRVAPYGCEDLVVKSGLACSPCSKRKCPGLGQICMRTISADMIWHRAKSYLRAAP